MVAFVVEALRPLLVPIGSVRPDPDNARIHPARNIEALKRSLSAYGQRKPIVVNAKTGLIDAGNGIWQAATELGWTHIAAVFVEDDPATATGYALMDNQSGLLSEWDWARLEELVGNLREMNFDLDLTGFGEHELAILEDLSGTEPKEVAVPEEGEASRAGNGEGRTVTCPKCGHEFVPR